MKSHRRSFVRIGTAVLTPFVRVGDTASKTTGKMKVFSWDSKNTTGHKIEVGYAESIFHSRDDFSVGLIFKIDSRYVKMVSNYWASFSPQSLYSQKLKAYILLRPTNKSGKAASIRQVILESKLKEFLR